ncbi:MAG: amidase family protein, partial [Fimbriiglobus sp.]
RPASYCGVCSLKPTWGRVSVDGVLPLARSLDHIGVMANCVRDLAEVFQVIAGYDPAAEMTRARPVRDCVRAIELELAAIPAESRRGEPEHRKRFLFAAETMPDTLDPEMAKFLRRFEADLRSLADSDAATDHIVLRPEFGEVHLRHRQVMAHEAAMVHKDRIRRRPDDYPPKIRELVADGLLLSAEELSQAEYIRRELQGDLYSQPWPDPLVTPATLGPAPTPDTTGDAWCNSPWSFLGLPTVSLPLGRTSDGMPLAVQFVGGENMEDYLLARAAWVEKVFELSDALKPRTLPPVT